MRSEAAHPRRACGRGWGQDQLAGGIGLTPLFGDGERLQHRDVGLPVDRHAIGDGAVQPRGAVVQWQQLGQHPLRLAECIAQQDRRFATLFAFAAPRHDLCGDRRGVRPAIDRQRERRFGDERIAGHHFEGRAGRVGLALVVAGRHPHPFTIVDAHLGRTEHMTGRMQRYLHPAQAERHPSACACTPTSPSRQRRIGRLPSLQWYSPMPGRAWSPCPWVMTARGTGRQGSMWKSPAAQYSPSGRSTTRSSLPSMRPLWPALRAGGENRPEHGLGRACGTIGPHTSCRQDGPDEWTQLQQQRAV